jgi:hypothetical protein
LEIEEGREAILGALREVRKIFVSKGSLDPLWVDFATRNRLIMTAAHKGLGLPLALEIEVGREAILAALQEARAGFPAAGKRE